MRAASTAGRTLWVRTMDAPWRMAATSAAMLAVSRAANWNRRGSWLAGVERRESVAEEGFAAESGEKRAAESEQFALAGEKNEVLVEDVCRSRSRGRVRCDPAEFRRGSPWQGWQRARSGRFRAACPDRAADWVRHSSGRPRVCIRMTPQRDSSADGGKIGVPGEAADVVDDFGAGGEGCARGGGLVGID